MKFASIPEVNGELDTQRFENFEDVIFSLYFKFVSIYIFKCTTA
jgi:hypothetical protein